MAEIPAGPWPDRVLLVRTFYVDAPVGFMGVYSSPDGPVFFVNDNAYRFLDTDWEVAVTEGADTNEFSLTVKGQQLFHFRYPKVEADSWDPWSSPDSDDFHLWLRRARSNVEYICEWTTTEAGGEMMRGIES